MATDTTTATSWHTVVPTALGELTLVRDGLALRGLYFPRHWYRPDPMTFGPRRDDGFDEVAGQLGEYLAGQRPAFDLALGPRGDGFQQRVWNLVRQVSHGDTVTYGALAGRLGGAVTAQQVGAAVGRNPLCILMPCHRVVRRGRQAHRLRRGPGTQAAPAGPGADGAATPGAARGRHRSCGGRPMNHSNGSAAQVERMDSDTKQWLFAAARRARQRYPGAVGELLSQELLSWLVFGHQLGSDLIMRVADDVLVEEPQAS